MIKKGKINSMDLRRLAGKSLEDLENENIEDDENSYGTVEKTSDLRIKNDINKKKYFKQE